MSHLEYNLLPFYVTATDEPSLQANMEEINETPESRAKCLEILRRELTNLQNIEPCMEETFLLRFLRVSKFNTSKALQRVLKYYKQQDLLIEPFKDLAMPYEKARSLNHIIVPPYRLKDNTYMHILLEGKIDYNIFTFAERFFLELMSVHWAFEITPNQIAGVTVLVDYKRFNFRAFQAHTPGWLLLYAETFMNACPARIQAVHIVNAPTLFMTLFKTVYPFFSKKIKERLFMHSMNDCTKLHAAIPVEILPEEFGGKLKLDSCINVLENIEELDECFRYSFKYGYITTKAKRQAFRPFR